MFIKKEIVKEEEKQSDYEERIWDYILWEKQVMVSLMNDYSLFGATDKDDVFLFF